MERKKHGGKKKSESEAVKADPESGTVCAGGTAAAESDQIKYKRESVSAVSECSACFKGDGCGSTATISGSVCGCADERPLAAYHGVENDQIFVGVGSDDVLSMCFLTFFNAEKPILFPDITYSFYKVWAQLYRIPYECPKLDPDFRLVKEDYYRENGGVIFPNPNAPTAIYEELDFVEDVIAHNPDVIVIVDEAYIDFAGRSADRTDRPL